MKILLIGNFSGNPDEGMKNVSYHYKKRLSEGHNVLGLSPRECVKLINLLKIKRFRPDIIHYIHGPSIRSLCIIKFLGLICPEVKTFVTATNPRIDDKWLRILPLLQPSLIFTQSKRTDTIFKKLGFSTSFFPNGVNVDKFKPVNKEVKKQLRNKYNIAENKFVILHVGHIRENRNLEIFSDIQNKIKNVQVIIVGSTHFNKVIDIERKLINSGCLVWKDYFEDINEIYCLSDCYVFPVKYLSNNSSLNSLTGCIEIPMSVLEAMACNLPVVTTKYGGLPDLFEEGDGLYFYENAEIFEKIKKAMKRVAIDNRERVIGYSWKKMITRLETIYRNSLQDTV